MNFSEFCIRRPVFTIVISVLLIIVGLVSYDRLTVRQYPDIAKPVVMVITQYDGASASLVESEITLPLEKKLATINGLDTISSTSQKGKSDIKIKFKLGSDLSDKVDDVRNRVAMVYAGFPKEVSAPIVIKSESDAVQTIILSVTDEKRSALELTDYLDRYVKPKIEQVDGVGSVDIWGSRTYAMRVFPDPTKMAARSVTAADINHALEEHTTDIPSGEIKGTARDFSIVVSSKLQRAEQFQKLVVLEEDGKVVRLGDVATIEVGPAHEETALRIEGKNALGVGVNSQPTANPIEVAAEVIKVVEDLQASLPPGMEIKEFYNVATYIKASIRNVYESIAEAIILVLLVVFLFLGSMRSASIPIVTIPICLIAVFSVLYLLGYSVNTVTLLALVLAIGLVVDDAIVMLENIHHHIEQGLTPLKAAITGSREIVFAIIAMTITLAAVYAPIGFTEGFTGEIFRQFAFTLAGAVVISGFVALTLTPMMCSRLLTSTKQETAYSKWLTQRFDRLDKLYRKCLNFVLARRMKTIIALLLIAMTGFYFYKTLPSELAPHEDEGVIFSFIAAPTDASFDYTNKYVKQVETIFSQVPEQESYLGIVGYPKPSGGIAVIILKPWDKRDRSQQEIAESLVPGLMGITGVSAFPISPPPLGQHGGRHGVTLEIMTSGSYAVLDDLMQHLVKIAATYPGLYNVESGLNIDSKQYEVSIDRDKVASLHVNMRDIASTLSTLLGGRTDQHFEFEGQHYDIQVKLPKMELQDLTTLQRLYVRNEFGKMIPLASFVSITEQTAPLELHHYNRFRSASLTAELTPGYSMDTIVNYLENLAQQELPSHATYDFTGTAKRFLESSGTMALAFVLALVFIYLVLSAQFESFIDPFIILLGVPLAVVGGLFTLKLTGGSLNLYSNIGMVTLIGLIAKHGILITEFANQQRLQGLAAPEAVVNAAARRLRPILMTTAAMALGAIPLALATGAGAESRHQIGRVIVGGLVFGTFFSLFVVPIAYTLLARFKRTQL